MFPTVQVDSRQAESLEQLGAKRKFWYRDGARRMLFKAEERGTGDDWAEKIACELAAKPLRHRPAPECIVPPRASRGSGGTC